MRPLRAAYVARHAAVPAAPRRMVAAAARSPVPVVHAAADQRGARLRVGIDPRRDRSLQQCRREPRAPRSPASSIGMALAIPLGLAIALNRFVADMFRPVLSFLQAIAGIAWVPLTIIWFGIGNGSVIFVIANTIFFASLYNTVIGVQSIPHVAVPRGAQPRRQRHCAADQPDPARCAGAAPARRAHVDGLRLARAGRLRDDRRQQRPRAT